MSHLNSKDHKHLGDSKEPKFQSIMPPPDEGSPYRNNETNISPMDVVPKASENDRVARAVQQGYTFISQPKCEKGAGTFPKETIKPWKPRGRKG